MPWELEEVDALIDPFKDAHDIVTLVTHYEVVGPYPNHIGREMYGYNPDIKRLERGEAVHFDLEQRTYQLLPTPSLK